MDPSELMKKYGLDPNLLDANMDMELEIPKTSKPKPQA